MIVTIWQPGGRVAKRTYGQSSCPLLPQTHLGGHRNPGCLLFELRWGDGLFITHVLILDEFVNSQKFIRHHVQGISVFAFVDYSDAQTVIAVQGTLKVRKGRAHNVTDGRHITVGQS